MLVITKTKPTGPHAGCLVTLIVFAKGVRGPLRPGGWLEMGHLRWAEGQRSEQPTWECALLPTPSQKGLGHGKDKTSKNVKCGDSTLLSAAV